MKIILFGNCESIYLFETAKSLALEGELVSIFNKNSGKVFIINSSLSYTDLKNDNSKKNIAISIFSALFFILSNFKFKNKNYDIVDIHYFDYQLIFYLPFFYLISKSTVITIYGDDFNSASSFQRLILKLAFYFTDSININNPVQGEIINKYYNDIFSKKFRVCRFGLSMIPIIQEYKKKYSLQELKSKCGYPLDKLIVNIGHSKTRDENQIEVLTNIVKNINLKDQIFITVLHTYGGDNELTQEVMELLIESKFQFKIYENFLSKEELATIRLATDIVIHALKNDQFSATVLESLYSGSQVIIGEWLPYKVLNDHDIGFTPLEKIEDIAGILSYCIKKRSILNPIAEKNLAKLTLWENNISDWIQSYNSALNKFKN